MDSCDRCGSEIAPANVDHAREIATCGACGNVLDLRARRQREHAVSPGGSLRRGPPQVSVRRPAPPAAAPRTRAVLLALLIPFGLVPSVVWFMVHTFTSDIEGSLELRGELGAAAFRPQDCSSGQVHGFSGVELTTASSVRRVRLIEDALGRSEVAVLQQHSEPVVVRPSDCKTFELQLVRTDTVTNDVYLMEGKVELDCPSVRGRVKFARCGL